MQSKFIFIFFLCCLGLTAPSFALAGEYCNKDDVPSSEAIIRVSSVNTCESEYSYITAAPSDGLAVCFSAPTGYEITSISQGSTCSGNPLFTETPIYTIYKPRDGLDICASTPPPGFVIDSISHGPNYCAATKYGVAYGSRYLLRTPRDNMTICNSTPPAGFVITKVDHNNNISNQCSYSGQYTTDRFHASEFTIRAPVDGLIACENYSPVPQGFVKGSYIDSYNCSATFNETGPGYYLVAKPTASASWSPKTQYTGRQQTYSWNSENATSCVNRHGVEYGTQGSTTVTAGTPGTYTAELTCTGAGGTVTVNASRTVIAYPKPSVSSYWSPQNVTAGQSQTYRWSSSNATSCVSGNGTPRATSGSVGPVTATSPGTFTASITCTGPGGSTTSYAPRTISAP